MIRILVKIVKKEMKSIKKPLIIHWLWTVFVVPQGIGFLVLLYWLWVIYKKASFIDIGFDTKGYFFKVRISII